MTSGHSCIAFLDSARRILFDGFTDCLDVFAHGRTTVMCTASCLFLSEAFALKLASILASLWCHWSLNTAVVVHVERGSVLLRLSWTFRAELVASYPAQSLAECSRPGKLVNLIMLTSVLDQSLQGSPLRNSARTSQRLLRRCQH